MASNQKTEFDLIRLAFLQKRDVLTYLDLRSLLASLKRKSTISLIIVTFISSYVIAFIIFPLPILKSQYSAPVGRILLDIFANFLFCATVVFICLFIDSHLNKKVSWMTSPLKRLFIQILLQILGVLILMSLVVLLYLIIWGPTPQVSPPTNTPLRFYYLYLLSLVGWTLLISTINTGVYMLHNWRAAGIKAMEFKMLAAQHQQLASQLELQALKLQLDPHFVFNNLSALSELILKDQRLGYEYTENFTKVYRYLLVNSKIKLVSLFEEMKFLKAYQFLIKHRIGKGCLFQVDIDDSKLSLKIPPMTLQLLIENALKHNRLEEHNPLVIRIHMNDLNELEVSNNLLPLEKSIDSTGMGLENIIDRYALLDGKEPIIEKNNDEFKVTISLFQ